MILAGLSGVETLDGKATGGGVDANPGGDPGQDPANNPTLKLLTASFADKASPNFRSGRNWGWW